MLFLASASRLRSVDSCFGVLKFETEHKRKSEDYDGDAHVDDVKVLLLPGLRVSKHDDEDDDDDDDGLILMMFNPYTPNP